MAAASKLAEASADDSLVFSGLFPSSQGAMASEFPGLVFEEDGALPGAPTKGCVRAAPTQREYPRPGRVVPTHPLQGKHATTLPLMIAHPSSPRFRALPPQGAPPRRPERSRRSSPCERARRCWSA